MTEHNQNCPSNKDLELGGLKLDIRKVNNLILLFGAFLLVFTSNLFGEEVEPHTFFEVRDLHNEAIYLRGEEIQSLQNHMIIKETTYRNPENDRVVQHTLCHLKEQDLSLEKYDLINYETGESLRMNRRNEEEVTLEYFVPKKMKQSVQKSLKFDHDYLGDAIHALVTRQWSELMIKGDITFRLFVPNRFDSFAFRFKKIQNKNGDLWFVMEPTSFLIRTLAPTMEFIYTDDVHHHLKEYRGPSPVPIAGESEKPVRVLFDYERGRTKK